jgi:DMSO reductase anchor subunit
VLNGWFLGAIGLAASGLHLGQPLKAWRVFLGLRRSWLSREIVVFGAWFACASVCAATVAFPAHASLAAPLSWRLFALLSLGGAGVFCSAMVYADTRRRFWRLPVTAGKFFGSTALFGLAAAWTLRPAAAPLAVALAAVSAVKLAFEARTFRCLGEEVFTPARKTALLLAGPLRRLTAVRYVCGALGGLLIPLLALGSGGAGSWPASIGVGLIAVAELAERALFFRAVDAPKMPGGPAG